MSFLIRPELTKAQRAAVDGLVEALQRCRKIVRLHNHRQNEKVEDVIGIVNQALAQIERKPEDGNG